MPPPADRPVTNTRLRSVPNRSPALVTICSTEAASPTPRAFCAASNQRKQESGLLAAPVCGKTTAKP